MAKNLRQEESVALETDTFSGRRPEPPVPQPPAPPQPPVSVGMGMPRRAMPARRPGTRVRDIDPPTVPGPSTIRPGTFATPAIPASMTPFRTPLFRAQSAAPISAGFGGGFGTGDEDIDDYLRRLGQ